MARTRTLTNLIADVRKAADVEGSTSAYPDAEITEYLNQYIAKFHTMMVTTYEPDYFAKIRKQTTVSGTFNYTFASHFQTTEAGATDTTTTPLLAQILSMSALVDNVSRPLVRFNENEYGHLVDEDAGWSGRPLFFRQREQSVDLLPTPLGAYVVTMRFVPSATRLSGGSDTFDGVDGWDTYVIHGAAYLVARKDHNHALVAHLKEDIAEDRAQLIANAPRMTREPSRVTDVRGFRSRLRTRTADRLWRP
jgi:hypothetical protein